ncbi:MAG: GTPase HflX [Dehalococcoidia bacterium]|nr:GTPase HflX [Dehalococcoidia bacterium]
MHSTAPVVERAYLVGVSLHDGRSWDIADSLDELAQLAATAGAQVVGRTSQRRERPDSATFIGKGKLQEIVAERETLDYTLVIFDDELSPSQQRNLENALKVKVLDRTALVLDIFAARARTREGGLQVELAQLDYLLPRLAGQWSHLERLEGAIGTRGPGETQIETDRRLARSRITHLKAQIEDVRRHRTLYRHRRAKQGIPVIALVGYTNAGKSTLMNALSGADVLAENKLFATLDPVTRRISLPEVGAALLTDTVGFIQKLPTGLVDAFRATLEELEEADILLHVVDITHPAVTEQSATVERTLDDLGLADKPRITVLNKADHLSLPSDGPVRALMDLADLEIDLARSRPDTLLISAARRWGLAELRAQLGGLLAMPPDQRQRLADARRDLPPLALPERV